MYSNSSGKIGPVSISAGSQTCVIISLTELGSWDRYNLMSKTQQDTSTNCNSFLLEIVNNLKIYWESLANNFGTKFIAVLEDTDFSWAAKQRHKCP